MLIAVAPVTSLASVPTNQFGETYIFDDFENGYNTEIWRSSGYCAGNGVLEISSDDSNNYLILDNSNAASSSDKTMLQLENNKNVSISGNTVIEFDMSIESVGASASSQARIFEPFFGTSSAALLGLKTDGCLRAYYYDETNTLKNQTFGTSNSFGSWYHLRFIIDADKHTYSLWNETDLVIDNLPIPGAIPEENNEFNALRIQLSNKGFAYKLCIDNFKIGKYLGFYEGNFTDGEGNTIYNTNNGTNKYTANIMNTSSFSAQATLIFAAYSENNQLLEKVTIVPAILEANKATDVTAALDGVDPSWRLKAFFVDNLSNIKPYKQTFGDVYAELDGVSLAEPVVTTVEISNEGYEGIKPSYPDGKYKAFTVRYDDGYSYDRTIISKLNEAGIKGTFYIAGKNIDANAASITKEELKTLYIDAGHEIANHTYNHYKMDEISGEENGIEFDPDIKKDIKDGKEFLEDILKTKINGFTSAYSSYGSSSTGTRQAYVNYLNEIGHTYAVLGESKGFDLPSFNDTYGVYGVKTTIGQIRDDNENGVVDIIEEGGYIDRWLALKPDEMKLFFIWGHAAEFENTTADYGFEPDSEGVYNNWQLADEICKVGGKSDTWYATNGDVIHYLLAHEAAEIILGTNSHKIYNPSDTITLTFDLGSRILEVRPKETVIINVV